MKKFLLVSALLAGSLSMLAQNITTKVTGNAEGAKMVYLLKVGARMPSDSVKVENGKFGIDVKMEKDAFTYLITENRMSVVVLNDGIPTNVDFANGMIKGSELNNRLGVINSAITKETNQIYSYYGEYMELQNQNTPEAKAKIEEISVKMNKAGENMTAISMKAIEDNIDNILSIYFINENYREMELEDLTKYVNKDYAYYNHPMMKGVKQYIKSMELKAPGKMFIDVAIPDENGVPHKLSEWCGKGKVVLIDFWASWCGPCRQEMPNVVENYKKYKDMGFEVIGISFDQSKDAWLSAVKKLGMEWPQLSELKSWDNQAGRMYGIQSIPSSVLVGKDGKIIALNLRGDALGNKLKEIFGK